MSSHDAIIRNARLIDGSGGTSSVGDVAIDGDRIHTLGSVDGDAPIDIDAEGLAVAPGFIDVHTHDDFAAILYPDMAFKLLGGVTTCVVGNCGMGAAPHRPASLMARAFHPNRSLPLWAGYSGYFDLLASRPPSVNIAALVGHGTLRLDAMSDSRREPSGAEMTHMKALLHEGLEAGAVGLSTGSVTEPMDAALSAGKRIRTGTVNVNQVPGYRIESSPFGGVKDSGLGVKEGVLEAIKVLTSVKTFSLPW